MSTKIALSGTHGTGKTTKVFQLARDIKLNQASPEVMQYVKSKNMTILCEVARDCPYPINGETSVEAQTWIFTEQVKRELDMAIRYDTIVLDRPIFDSVAYTMRIDRKLGESMLDMATHVLHYDLIYVLFPKRLNLEVDGVRDTNEIFQTEVHEILMSIYERIQNRYNITYCTELEYA